MKEREREHKGGREWKRGGVKEREREREGQREREKKSKGQKNVK